MSNTLNYNINFGVQNDNKVVAAVSNITASLVNVDKGVFKVDNAFGQAFNNIQNRVKNIQMSSILDQVDRFAGAMQNLAGPGDTLSSSMAELSAMTGVTGAKLKEIEGYARENGIAFGTGAAGGAEAFKLILSQLNPEIAQTPEALKSMGQTIAVTSKLMGGDVTAATEVLTTAMNQYQVSTADPIAASLEMSRMMNIMAAAAQEGSAELPQIKGALEQTGMAAKTANVSFAETNAAIQVLDKAGKRGAEGGVALRNIMTTLAEGRFLPPKVQQELQAAGVDINKLTNDSLSLSERLKPLQGVMGDTALITKLFGKENMNAAIAIISGIGELERYTNVIQGTASATDQAAIIMESPAEKAKRLQARIDDLKISTYNATGGWLSFAATIGSGVRDMSGFAPVIMGVGNGIMWLTKSGNLASIATKVWTSAQWVLNAAMTANPIGIIIVAIAALVGAIVWVVSKTEGWGQAWGHTVEGAKLLWQAFTTHMKFTWDVAVSGMLDGLDWVAKKWYQFKNAVGIGDSSQNAAMIADIDARVEARAKAITEGANKIQGLYEGAAREFVEAAGSIRVKAKVEEDGAAAGTKAANDFTANAGNIHTQATVHENGAAAGTKAANDFTANAGNIHTQATVHENGAAAGTKAAYDFTKAYTNNSNPFAIEEATTKGIKGTSLLYWQAGQNSANSFINGFSSQNVGSWLQKQISAFNGISISYGMFDKPDAASPKKWQFSNNGTYTGNISVAPKVVVTPTPGKTKIPGGGISTTDGKRGDGSKDGTGKAAAKTNEAIATGGQRNVTVNLTIGKQIETLTIQAANGLQEGAEKIKDIIVDELTRAITMAQSMAL